MKRSPLFVEIALYYHYSPSPWPTEEMHDAQEDVHERLHHAGLIEMVDGVWRGVAEPLRLYVEAICSIPLPVKKWTISGVDQATCNLVQR